MPARKYTDEEIEQAVAMFEAGKTHSAISAQLGMSKGAVDYYCLKLGADHPRAKLRLPPEPKSYHRGDHTVRRFTEAEDKQLLAMDLAGKTPTEIGRALNRKHNSITGRLRTLARREARREEQEGVMV